VLSSFRPRFICLVGGAESPFLPNKADPSARPVDPPQRNARSGTSLFPFRIFLLSFGYCLISQMLIRNIAHSHLPVKSMLFHCPVCSHGGHQACYRQFYTEMPLVLLPPPPRPPSPGSPLKLPHHPCRSASRSKDGDYEDVTDIAVPDDPFDTATVTPAPRQLMGHACATGCGHFCWIANFREDDEKS
jgi:WD repeat-containing protein 24